MAFETHFMNSLSFFHQLSKACGVFLQTHLLCIALVLFSLFPNENFAITDQGVIGWDGDKNAGLAMLDGSIGIRDRPDLNLTGPELRWGIRGVGYELTKDLPANTKIDWYNAEGWLPALVSRLDRDGCTITITNFADKIVIGGNEFVAAYSRVVIHNHSGMTKIIHPGQSAQWIALRQASSQILDQSSAIHDFVIVMDRFGKAVAWPDRDSVRNYQTWDQAYEHMRSFWCGKMDSLLKIKQLPDTSLIDQCKADYCHARILMDGKVLHAGEFGYDHTFSHDLVSQIIHLFLMGEFDHAHDWLDGLVLEDERVKNYPDATYKYSWPFALYLKLTGDDKFVMERFEKIQRAMRVIVSHRDGPDGVMGRTWALDHFGFWTIDNFAALQGLGCYAYICRKLGKVEELRWAEQQYESLFQALNSKLVSLSPDKISNRLDGFEPGGILFAFGAWPWDGYLWNLPQGTMPSRIDASYKWLSRNQGFKSPHIWAEPWGGSLDHPAFFSYYSVGATCGMLRGNNWRGEGIRAFQFMIQHAQQGPRSYWECATMPDESRWNGIHPHSGYGDCPHIFGAALAEKVLVESLLAERSDGSIIIGRGIPDEWCKPGSLIEIVDVPITGRRKTGFRMEAFVDRIELVLIGDSPEGEIFVDLPLWIRRKPNPSVGRYDASQFQVVLPTNVRKVTFFLGSLLEQ